MPTKKQKLSHPTSTLPISPSIPVPQLPLDVIDRIYAKFDPVINEEDRYALALSLRVNKAFHDIVAPHLYREVGLNWLVNKDYSWKGTRYGKFAKLASRRRRKNYLSTVYLQHVRYLFARDHKHTRLFHSISSSPSVVDVLEIERFLWHNSPHEKWCNSCDPGSSGDSRPRLVRCNGLAEFQAKTVILACSHLFDVYTRSGPLGTPRFPPSTFSRTDRVVIRPEFCTRYPLRSYDRHRLLLGSVPASVKRVDVVLEPALWNRTHRHEDGHPAAKEMLLQTFCDVMFDVGSIIPESCTIYIVNIGQLGANIDPDSSTTQTSRSSSQIQTSVEAKIGQLIIQAQGDTPATKAKMARLKFISFEEYAQGLKGMQRKCIGEAGWDSLRDSMRVRKSVEIAKAYDEEDSDGNKDE